jgi:hypothetical protein
VPNNLTEPPCTLVATARNLQDTIDDVALSDKQPILNLLVSSEVPEIAFHVPSHFSQLKVLRCRPNAERGTLFVDGASTYNNVRLDKWQAHRHKHHTLIIGHEGGVRIRLHGIAGLPNWARCRNIFTPSEEEALCQHFGKLSGKSCWEDVKGTVAAILGIAVGTAKFAGSLSGAVGGIYVKYAFGLQSFELGAAGAKLTTIVTAAGPAVVLGVTAAAAIYFIPWEGLFAWLKGCFSWLWDKICHVWQKFMGWVRNWFFSSSTENVPMTLS